MLVALIETTPSFLSYFSSLILFPACAHQSFETLLRFGRYQAIEWVDDDPWVDSSSSFPRCSSKCWLSTLIWTACDYCILLLFFESLSFAVLSAFRVLQICAHVARGGRPIKPNGRYTK